MLYFLVHKGRYQEATSLLQTLLRSSSKNAKAAGGKTTALGPSERVSVYLELVECLRLASQEVEATKLLADAQTEFEGTPQAMRVQLATVDMSLQNGDVDGAISTLRAVCAGVTPGSRDYFDARLKLARIYLEHRNDKRRYAACFEELAQSDPSPRNLMALGDAFMNILEVDKAIEVRSRALPSFSSSLSSFSDEFLWISSQIAGDTCSHHRRCTRRS